MFCRLKCVLINRQGGFWDSFILHYCVCYCVLSFGCKPTTQLDNNQRKTQHSKAHAQAQTWVRRVAQSQSWERVIVVVKAAGGACGGAPAVGAGAAALP